MSRHGRNPYRPCFNDRVKRTWRDFLETEMRKPYYTKLEKYLADETSDVYPPQDQVFSWAEHFEIEQTKVVILGQDPYPAEGKANGLCFSDSNRDPGENDSLKGIFEEVKRSCSRFAIPDHGNLTGWAKQGVLLLNRALTVRKGVEESHLCKGWETMTDAVIKVICERCQNVVFMLWGRKAQKVKSQIKESTHHVLEASHPSPRSAYKSFKGCGHFTKANEIFRSKHLEEISWTNL